MTLQATALDIGYPGRVVGRGFDLMPRPGEVLALLGPNGGGKTTLLAGFWRGRAHATTISPARRCNASASRRPDR